MIALLKFGAVLASCAVLMSCANQYFGGPNQAEGVAALAPATDIASAGPSSEYRIGARDVVQVSVFQVPDLARTVPVNADGTVILPLIGNVRISGKTIEEAEREIAARFAKGYLQSPQVTVSLVKSGQRIVMNGAVKSPSVITVDGRLVLSQALSQAGGVSDIANTERVHVVRIGANSQVNDVVINFDQVLAGKATDPQLYGGDVVIVEESNAKVAFNNVKQVMPFLVLYSIASDRRLKRDIVPLGITANHFPLYRYRYLWSDTLYVGVMAQDVAPLAPEAVSEGPDGFLRVNYFRLGLPFQTWKQWQAEHAQAAVER